MKTTYYEIDGRKFKLEQIREDAYWLTMREKIGTHWEGDRLVPTYCDTCYPFKGKTAYADAMAEILSYSEIDPADFADEEE